MTLKLPACTTAVASGGTGAPVVIRATCFNPMLSTTLLLPAVMGPNTWGGGGRGGAVVGGCVGGEVMSQKQG